MQGNYILQITLAHICKYKQIHCDAKIKHLKHYLPIFSQPNHIITTWFFDKSLFFYMNFHIYYNASMLVKIYNPYSSCCILLRNITALCYTAIIGFASFLYYKEHLIRKTHEKNDRP